jgi:hypothetical protein
MTLIMRDSYEKFGFKARSAGQGQRGLQDSIATALTGYSSKDVH